MAAEALHVSRARANESFARLLSPADRGDWRIIVSFYAALHYVEARLSRLGQTSSDHRNRRALMRKFTDFAPVRNDYETLSNFAWSARYDPALVLQPDEVQNVVDLLPAIRTALGF